MINGIFRAMLAFFFSVSARFVAWDNRLQRRKFRKRYAFFYGRNALGSYPVSGFDGQKDQLRQVYEKMASPKYFAQTSGTTSEPKLVPYDARRTRQLRKVFLRSMMTLTRDIPGNKTFFVFASLRKDDSLTSGLMGESGDPSYLELLQAPYRFLHTKEGKALIERVGELTARIMVLAITQPRILYATNPSTLTFFLKELESRWKEVRVRLKSIPPELMRLSDSNGERLLMTFLIRDKAPGLQELLPDLKAVITWDGGYVKPFIDQLRAQLPGVKLVPMFSMSTETLETLPHRINGKIYFLPVIRGVFPEFEDLELGKVLTPFELEVGKSYELIISDEWGLRRYATGDIFHVKGLVNSLPDLAFVKRRGMTSSLTGEKLTEEQVRELSELLGKKFPSLSRVPISLYPVSRNGEYGYEMAVIAKGHFPGDLAEVAEKELKKINREYGSKVISGRLQPLSVTVLSEHELATLMGKSLYWESQFKVLPLYEKLVLR